VPAAETQTESPGDALIVSWAQADIEGERTVLLQWPAAYRHYIYLPLTIRGGTQSAAGAAANATAGAAANATAGAAPVATSAVDATTDGYSIWRRLSGDADWGFLETVSPVTTPDDLVTVLGQDLVDQLCLDLRASADDPPLTLKQLFERLRRDTALVKMLQGQYYQVGLAMGTSYLDRGAPKDQTLEYRVLPLKGSLQFTPARVPSATSSLPTPTGLREVWTGPAALGVRPSSRPNGVDERFSWIEAQDYRPWNGTVYLIWDIPTDTGSLDDGLTAFNLAGYRVYRAPSTAGPWEKVNPSKADCAHPGSVFCEILTGLMLPPETQDGFPQFFFREDLHEVLTDPAQLYKPWTYKVCPVDGLRNEGVCSAPVSVPAREVMPPAPAHNLVVQPNLQQTQLQLTWVYSDTGDVSQPLRFYVTRSPTLTAPLDSWTPVTPTNATVPYHQLAITGPVTLTVVDVPPKDQVFWYRVQVRDNAGNWSAPGQAAKGALYTRTDPAFVPVPGYNAQNCAANPMPVTLTGLSAEVRQIAVYRGFAAGGPWHLVKRVTVENGTATITDAYVPPYATDVYYRLEAVDGHGNASGAQPYCAHLEGSDILPPPPPITTTVTQNDNVYVWTAEVGDTDTPDESQPPTVITVTMPGEDGPITQTLPVTDTASGQIPSGAWIEIDGTTTGSGGAGASSESWLRVTNNFIDTERQMTDLGSLHELQWEVSQTADPYVVVNIVTVDEWSPPLALFRRIPGRSWLQVTEVRRVQPHIIEDRADPSPYQTYEYAVLLFSPTTYEVMGYWGPATLTALYPAQTLALGGDPIEPVTPYPGTCAITEIEPGGLVPPTIDLANGWIITDVHYFTSTGGVCPPPTVDVDSAYGRGLLSFGRNVTKPVTFYDIAITKGLHTGGKIVALLNYDTPSASALARHFGLVEFTADGALQGSRAEVTITLPSDIRLRTGSGDANRVAGIFSNVTSNLAFDPAYPVGTIVDENLPWRLSGTEMAIDEREITFGAGDVTTTYRLDYGPDATVLQPGDPNNNLAFMQPVYTSADVVIGPSGVNGTFVTDEDLSYTTSLPASVEVRAQGAELTISGSRIQRGLLRDASAWLTTFDRGTNIDYATVSQACGGSDAADYWLCEWTFGALRERTLTMTVTMPDSAIAIGADGLMTASVALDSPAGWPSFEVASRDATLYLASAAPGGSGATSAPLPAENAWRQLVDPVTLGTLDPGINLNANDAVVLYTFYTPPEFEPTSMDLYIRRGGASGHLIMSGGGPRENAYGYSEVVQRIELLVIDNGVVSPPLDYQTDLYLGYPTDAWLRMDVWQVNPGTNRPVRGGFREATTVLHKYWDFTETPQAWQYSPVGSDYGGALGGQEALLALTNSRAAVAGLGTVGAEPGTVTVTLALASEWLPDGDIGAVRLYAPPALEYRISGFYATLSGLRLSRYNSTPLAAGSLPETLGIDVGDDLGSLPAQLLDSGGALTPASLQACATGGTVGCGLVVIDGNVAVEYFGELREAPLSGFAASDLPTVDELVGMVPVAVNTLGSIVHEMMVKAIEMPWIWPVINDALEVDLPVKFLGNTKGGVLVALGRNATVFPDEKLFSTDVSAVVSARWGGTNIGTVDRFGIFLGYPASQAAFRALAMNRPAPADGVLPYEDFADVETDMRTWADKFGYNLVTGDANDPVDLARDTWVAWEDRQFDKVYDVVEPVLWSLGGREAYGVNGLEAGDALLPSGLEMNNGALVAAFHQDGMGWQLSALEGGTQMGYDIYYLDLWLTEVDVFLEMDWIAVEMNRDGEVIFHGSPYLNLIGDYGVDGEFFGMAFPDSPTEWRVEATIDLDTIGIAGIAGLDLAGEFGSGPYNGDLVSYIGVRGEGNYMDYRVGGGVLFGTIYDSPVLRRAGYGELIDTLGDANTYTGIYLFVNGDFPVVEGTSCLLKASAAGEFRFWYFWDQDVGGGRLSGAVHATVLCVVSGRGQVDLQYARLDQGGQSLGRTCESSACDLFGGRFWVALGVGWCSPGTWDSWYDRWWDDDWCYTFGAVVDLTYMSPGGLEFDADLDFE